MTNLTLSPELAKAFIRGEKTFTRRPIKAYHRLQSNPTAVVSVLKKGVNDNPPKVYSVGQTMPIHFGRTLMAAYYRIETNGLINLITPDREFRTMIEQQFSMFYLDWFKQHDYLRLEAEVTAIFREPLSAMDNRRAKLEGFVSGGAFKTYWRKLYGDQTTFHDPVWVLGICPPALKTAP